MQFNPLNAAQRSSIHFTVARAWARPLGERSEPLQLQGLCLALMEFARNSVESYDSIWKLLVYVANRPAVLESDAQRSEAAKKSSARFPFLVKLG